MSKKHTLLSKAIMINFFFSLISGLILIIWSQGLSEVFGINNPFIFTAIGTVLIAFSVSLYIIARLKQIPSYLAWTIISLDLAWVAGSIILIAIHYLTPTGDVWTSVIAFIVLLIAILQMKGQSRTIDS